MAGRKVAGGIFGSRRGIQDITAASLSFHFFYLVALLASRVSLLSLYLRPCGHLPLIFADTGIKNMFINYLLFLGLSAWYLTTFLDRQ